MRNNNTTEYNRESRREFTNKNHVIEHNFNVYISGSSQSHISPSTEEWQKQQKQYTRVNYFFNFFIEFFGFLLAHIFAHNSIFPCSRLHWKLVLNTMYFKLLWRTLLNPFMCVCARIIFSSLLLFSALSSLIWYQQFASQTLTHTARHRFNLMDVLLCLLYSLRFTNLANRKIQEWWKKESNTIIMEV